MLPLSLERWFLRYLYISGRLPLSRLVKNLFSLAHWPLQAQELKLFYLAGQPTTEVEQWITAAWENDIVHRIYAGWRPVLTWLQAQGARIVLLSGTPRPLAEPLMCHLQIQEALCAEPEIVDGRYTGRLLRPHPRGRRKVDYASAWIKSQGMDWNHTIAVANAWPDRFFMEKARPVAVQPSRRLRRHALRHGWPIEANPADEKSLLRALKTYF